MSVITYQNLALDWQPAEQSSRRFQRIIALTLIAALALMYLLTVIKVPEENRRPHAEVPERIADFIARKEKPVVQVKKPKVKPLPPPPPVVEQKPEEIPPSEPATESLREKFQARSEQRSLTASEKAARKVAAKSGLLAMANELNDLANTTEIQAKVGKTLSRGEADAGSEQGRTPAGYDAAALSAGIAQTGGTVDQTQHAAQLSSTQLETRKVEKTALSGIEASSKTSATGKAKSGSAGEDISLVFDRNKSILYSLYERERRTSPDLQGKIVFQLTISPAGDVLDVKIISSDLNNPELEARLLSRIKGFKFKAGGDKPTTITYPVEFLPA